MIWGTSCSYIIIYLIASIFMILNFFLIVKIIISINDFLNNRYKINSLLKTKIIQLKVYVKGALWANFRINY